MAVRIGRRSLSARDSTTGRIVDGGMDRRHELERGDRSLEELHAPDAPRDRTAVSVARLHAHPAEGTRSHPVRARHLSAEPAVEDHAAAGDRVHGGAFDHARAVDLWRRLVALTHRRAADRLVDCLRRYRKPGHARIETVASRARLHVWFAARTRIRGSVT